MSSLPTWGVVSTIKAPATDILNFAAHHLDLGAHRVHVYLDEDCPEARAALSDHPKCRVTLADETNWGDRPAKRPAMHQPRQTMNATHCYQSGPEVDWLAHIDVDEFLWPAKPLPDLLAALPAAVRSARVRPIESLAPDPADPPPEGQIWAKGCARIKGQRGAETKEIYPTYHDHLVGGLIGHVLGKVFVRTGLSDVSLRIHQAFFDGERDDDTAHMEACRLVHLHATDWDHWYGHYRWRLKRGSYRPSLGRRAGPEGMSLTVNEFFAALEEEGGEAALRDFFEEVCTATPTLRARLERYGHLHAVRLELDAKRAAQFPGHG